MTENPLPPEPGTDHTAFERKAVSGAKTLVVRTIVLQLLIIAGNLVLARVLDPKDFGVFSISQFALTFFVYFGDAGLAGALVQQHDMPTDRKLSSVLWLQLMISAAIVVAVWLASPLSHLIWRDLPVGSEWLLRALSFELMLTAARTVPSLLMERELNFGRLSLLEVTNQIAFYCAALPLAIMGYGVWALVVGVLTRATVGVALAYVLRPWRPIRVIDWDELRPIVKFGIPYQMKNVVAFVNSAVIPIYAGHVLGTRSVGIIGWSRNLAFTPLKLVEIMSRVGFPLYARLQNDRKALGNALGRSIQVCTVGTFVFIAMLFGLAPDIIRIAYPKWTEALIPLYLFAGTFLFGFLTPIVAAAYDATARPQVFLRMSIGWTLLAWAIVPFTTPRWGLVGFVAGYNVHTIAGNLLVIWMVQQTFPTANLGRRVRWIVAAAAAEALAGRFVFARFVSGPVTLVLAALACGLCFVAIVATFDRDAIADALSALKRTPRSSSA